LSVFLLLWLLRERAEELMPAHHRSVHELRELGILRGALVNDLVERILVRDRLASFGW